MFHVIDDIKDLRDILKELVVEAGYEVLCFSSATHYLDHLNSPAFQKPTAVLSDVDMPDMSGHQLALEIRKQHESQKIIFLTGLANGDHYKFSTSQLCGTLEKPYHPHELIMLLNSLSACHQACEYSDSSRNLHECGFGIDTNCPFHSTTD